MLNKLIILLTHFHEPFLEAFGTWAAVVNPDTDIHFSSFLWEELSFFLSDDPTFPTFFEWYGATTITAEDLEDEDYDWAITFETVDDLDDTDLFI